jgi:uncharacterized protein (UPF0332 family)
MIFVEKNSFKAYLERTKNKRYNKKQNLDCDGQKISEIMQDIQIISKTEIIWTNC